MDFKDIILGVGEAILFALAIWGINRLSADR